MKPEPLKNKIRRWKQLDEMITLDVFGKCVKCGKETWVDSQLFLCNDCFMEIAKNKPFVWVDDVKKAVEFYLRYKDSPEKLWNEREEFKCIELEEFMSRIDTKKYNEWLFKLAFADVLKNEEERDGDGKQHSQGKEV